MICHKRKGEKWIGENYFWYPNVFNRQFYDCNYLKYLAVSSIFGRLLLSTGMVCFKLYICVFIRYLPYLYVYLWACVNPYQSILFQRCILRILSFNIKAIWGHYLKKFINFFSCVACPLFLIYIYIYICCHPKTDCFIKSQLFSVARHAWCFKMGLKPV